MVSLTISKVDRLECAYAVYPILPAIPTQSKSYRRLKWFSYVHDVILEVNDYLILCAYEFGVKYSICLRVLIMEMKDVLHAFYVNSLFVNESVTQPTTIQDAILRAGILTDEVISYGTLSKSNEKRKAVEETGKSGGSWRDKKKAKMGAGFVATTPPKNEFRPGHFGKDCRAPFKRATPVNAIRMEFEPGTCYECGSREHFRNTCPKLNRSHGQVGNRLTIEGNRNTINNGKRATGRAFNVNVNAVEALQDPKVVTGTFSLNDHFATVLFDSGADFSFISTEFAPLLNVKPSIVNPGYVIEVADGKKVEVDISIRDCKLELGNSLFSINLIPLGHGSFDVIVGMDWLSQNKAVIVCHEKVVEIPLKGSGILRVQGERTLGAAKALMNAKVDE
ncbi:putative reverse transcriptase domain-containing protein [Tanacetum coccineum]